MKSKCILATSICRPCCRCTRPMQTQNDVSGVLNAACVRSVFMWLFIHSGGRCQSSAGCCLCAAGFPLPLHFGRRSMAVWMCADMLTVLLHQLFGKREVKATPASCFQRGVLCVYPQATIKASREPRFNHMHHSCPTETHCSKAETG